MSPIVAAENITKRFGNFIVLDDLSLSIDQGEIYGGRA